LSPGSKIAAGGFVGYTIAYNADESDLLTEKDETIKLQGLRTVDDLFLSLHENFEKKNAAQGPYLCPRCKTASLTLHFAGYWD
jgi:hypothetical protein